MTASGRNFRPAHSHRASKGHVVLPRVKQTKESRLYSPALQARVSRSHDSRNALRRGGGGWSVLARGDDYEDGGREWYRRYVFS